ncbi:MAG TPA: GNAT family N-acetyltransferase [Thermoanaerobaculia bacterium]
MAGAGTITLRAADEPDEPFLFELYVSTRAEEMAAWNWPPAQRDAFLRMQFTARRSSYRTQHPGAEHSIVLENGKPVGQLLVSFSDPEVCLVDVSVSAEARGRGIGTKLIADLMVRCAALRRTLKLSVATSNAAARRLYERMGFVRSGGDAMYDEMLWTPMLE